MSVKSGSPQIFVQVVACPHNITWLLRICNVFSNFISLSWNYAAQHNSTWLQTSRNTKGLQLLGICMLAFICIRKLQELCWLGDPSIRASASIHSKHKAQLWWEFVSPVSNHRCGSANCSNSAPNQVSGSFGLSALHVSEESSCLLHSSCWTWRVILIPTWEACFSIQLECSALSTLLRVFSVVLFSSQVSTLFYSSALLCSAWVLRLVSLDLTRRHQWWQIIRLLCHHLLSKKTKICSTSRQIIAGLL